MFSPARAGRAVADCTEYYGVFTLLALMEAVATVASCPLATMTRGFHDAVLQRIDLMLHFNWLAWYRLVVASPLLQTLGLAAYRSIALAAIGTLHRIMPRHITGVAAAHLPR